jgi:Ca-activated chloride channel family protein
MKRFHRWVWIGLLLGGLSVRAAPASEPGEGAERVPGPAVTPGQPETGKQGSKDPFLAYQQGDYERALEGFLELQVRRPDDLGLELALGSANYQLGRFEAAERHYRRALESDQSALRAESLYDLGNALFRQGRLEEAAQHYEQALDEDPGDLDSKFNLELVRERLQQSPPPPESSDGGQESREENGEGETRNQQPPGSQETRQDQGGEEGDGTTSPPTSGDEGAEAADQDGDGLPDQVEEQGRNPTDPNNPDTDGDGRPDGEEDQNQNGEVDPGESDPNSADAPGVDTADGSEAETPAANAEPSMTPEEAQRLLAAVDEQRPRAGGDQRAARRARPEKDW